VGSELRSVSDTALITADMRAKESERRTPLFIDPYAARLAGDRGRRIAPIRRRLVSPGGVVARTAVFDEIIVDSIHRYGIGTVLNLGAGLDARPYRLELPTSLLWIEADLPAIIEYKSEKLEGASPRCKLEHRSVDLSDATARQRLVAELGDEPLLVLSEGLVPYLTEDAAGGLARDLSAFPSVKLWCLDMISAAVLPWANRLGGRTAAAAGIVGGFAPKEGPAYFRQFGWQPIEVRSLWLEQRRVGREPLRMRAIWTLSTRRLRDFYRDMGQITLLSNVKDSSSQQESAE
jgi:methyltransferase (TIGR00027 family)